MNKKEFLQKVHEISGVLFDLDVDGNFHNVTVHLRWTPHTEGGTIDTGPTLVPGFFEATFAIMFDPTVVSWDEVNEKVFGAVGELIELFPDYETDEEQATPDIYPSYTLTISTDFEWDDAE